MEIALAELSSKVDGMESCLCQCGQVDPSDVTPLVEDEGLKYAKEYYTPLMVIYGLMKVQCQLYWLGNLR